MYLYLLFGAACLITGFLLGLWAETLYASAAMSRSQEWMQAKVRQAQEAAQGSLIWGTTPTASDDQERW